MAGAGVWTGAGAWTGAAALALGGEGSSKLVAASPEVGAAAAPAPAASVGTGWAWEIGAAAPASGSAGAVVGADGTGFTLGSGVGPSSSVCGTAGSLGLPVGWLTVAGIVARGMDEPLCGRAAAGAETGASVFPSSGGNGGRSFMSPGAAGRGAAAAVCAGAGSFAGLGIDANVMLSVSVWARPPELSGWLLLFASGGKGIRSSSIAAGFVGVGPASVLEPDDWASAPDEGGVATGAAGGVLIAAGAAAGVVISAGAGEGDAATAAVGVVASGTSEGASPVGAGD